MPTTTEPSGVLAWAGAALLTLAVLRVVYVFVAGGDVTDALWRRRWTEIGLLVSVGVALALLALWIS